ncbi:unnamed protein product [Prorocentrum cordatum]|uniref:Uncharacterized protein n=1 Tax=Prorocentrum cordatum TaxID=2364126 RepID=A0ABN9TQD0_9DINO|nr:unnamed protein product [Polarella glacialis]
MSNPRALLQCSPALSTARSCVGERAHVLSIATEYRQEAVILERCALLLGYEFQFCGLGEEWVGWGTKLVQYRRSLEKGLGSGSIAPADPVMLIDGWDCALVGPADEFCEKMASEASRIDEVAPGSGTPWRYPNAGAVCGRAGPVLQLVEDLLEGLCSRRYLVHDFPDGNDQDRVHEHLLEHGERGAPLPFLVDDRCGIFQCLYESEPQWDIEDLEAPIPRLRNRVTGERPLVLHGNGHTGRWFLSGLWRELELLRRVDLTPGMLAHLPYDGPVPPGTVPDEATERNWVATFELYRIIEKQMEYARKGLEWDPWKIARGEMAPGGEPRRS